MTKNHSNILQKMQVQIDSWEKEGDPRSIFLNCYCMMTGNMLKGIENNRFEDAKWVSTLLHRFADYYFDALICYDCGDQDIPLVWKEVHESADNEQLHVLQHLLMGVNAHINYDLVLTLHDLLGAEWGSLSKEQKQMRYSDHCMVNDIIAETIDQVQDEVVEKHDRFMAFIDRVFGRLDEMLLSRLITNWRKEVWDKCMQLLSIANAPEKQAFLLALENEVLKRNSRLKLQF